MKKHRVNPNCQNSEPTKRTVSISAQVFLGEIFLVRDLPVPECQILRVIIHKTIDFLISETFPAKYSLSFVQLSQKS